MPNLNRLNRLKELLWQKYDDEIKDQEDWFYYAHGWTYNFIENPQESSVTIYRCKKDQETNYSDYIILEKYVKKWEKVA